MLLWFAGLSVVAVWVVFRDPALDLRLVVAGALLPDVVDLAGGGAGLGHSAVGSVVLLATVMVVTGRRRRLRRRLLALPIGSFLHLVLDGIWTDTTVFWWPAAGLGFGGAAIPSVDRGLVNLPLEAAGLVALMWAWNRFRLREPARRRAFLRTGRLGRDLVEP